MSARCPTLISGSDPIVIQGEREHRVSRSAGGARQGLTLAGADAGQRGADAGLRVSAGADAGQGLALMAAVFGAHGQLGSAAGDRRGCALFWPAVAIPVSERTLNRCHVHGEIGTCIRSPDVVRFRHT